MTIDLSGNWNLEKIIRLSTFLMCDYGPVQDIELFIDTKSYSQLLMNTNGISNPDTWDSGQAVLCIYANAGRVYIYPTTGHDKIYFSANKVDYSFIISNKLKDYKQEFDEIVKD